MKALAAKPEDPKLILRGLTPTGSPSDLHMPPMAHPILIVYFLSLVLLSVWLFLLKQPLVCFCLVMPLC